MVLFRKSIGPIYCITNSSRSNPLQTRDFSVTIVLHAQIKQKSCPINFCASHITRLDTDSPAIEGYQPTLAIVFHWGPGPRMFLIEGNPVIALQFQPAHITFWLPLSSFIVRHHLYVYSRSPVEPDPGLPIFGRWTSETISWPLRPSTYQEPLTSSPKAVLSDTLQTDVDWASDIQTAFFVS